VADRERPSIPEAVKVEVFFRDHWLCYLCRRPTVFPMAFKLLSEVVESELPGVPLAFYHPHWRRDQSPLLDELGVEVDHVHAFSKDGADDIANFATVCVKCNTRKSARSKDTYLEESNPWTVKAKHGEPEHWDGLASLFVVLARKTKRPLTSTEKEWLRAFEAHYKAMEDAPSLPPPITPQ